MAGAKSRDDNTQKPSQAQSWYTSKEWEVIKSNYLKQSYSSTAKLSTVKVANKS